jgi:hypothetical protein
MSSRNAELRGGSGRTPEAQRSAQWATQRASIGRTRGGASCAWPVENPPARLRAALDTGGMKRRDARNASRPQEPDPELDSYASDVVAFRSKFIACSARAFSNAHANAPTASSSGCETCRIGAGFRSWSAKRAMLSARVASTSFGLPIHGVPVRSYLKATGCHLGLLINFTVPLLRRGVRRGVRRVNSPDNPASWRPGA